MIGFSADSGSTITLSQRMGFSRAKRFLLLSETIDAAEAQRAGLVDFVTASESLMPHAEAMALKLAAGPTLAYSGIKQTMLRARTQGLESQMEEEAQTLAAIARKRRCLGRAQCFQSKAGARISRQVVPGGRRLAETGCAAGNEFASNEDIRDSISASTQQELSRCGALSQKRRRWLG